MFKFTTTANKDGSTTLYLNGKKVARAPEARLLDQLKSPGLYHVAGAYARHTGRDRNYGCHFGMRSTVDHARAEFARGWDAAK